MKKYLLLSCLTCSQLMAQELIVEEIPLEQPTSSLEIQHTLPSIKNDISWDDLYTLLNEQKHIIRDLTERLEKIEYRLKQTEEKMERTNQDLVFRVNELESKPAVLIDKNSDKERYDYAYHLLQEHDYAKAETQFLSFIKDFEKSDLTPNAIYWLGETYYVQQQFEKAVGQFSDVFTKYPTSNKAPDALLKMGLSMISLNKKAEACTAFIALPNEYPKAPDSLKQRANEEAKKNQCS